ncbi:MAG: ABC transporter permease [Dehalococcoidia bacterium]|nr:ABC transporter permease [Dehalococcoidia bacterium]
MLQLIIQRCLLSLATVFIVTVITFSLVRVIPGDPAVQLLGESYSEQQAEVIHERLGLNEPYVSQYLKWIGGLVRGDLGTSLLPNRQPIGPQIVDRMEPTLLLMALTIIFSVGIGIPIGVIAALRQDTPIDYALRSFSILGLSVPGFYLATQVLGILAKEWHWIPPIGWVSVSESPFEAGRRLWMPALILSLATGAQIMRMARSMMLEVMRQDYIRTAWAKGLSERKVIVGHALRNAMMPVLTIIGLSMAFLIGGTVIFESLFGLPGMGMYMINSVIARDYVAVQSITVVFALGVVGINLLIDISYLMLDPRLRQR